MRLADAIQEAFEKMPHNTPILYCGDCRTGYLEDSHVPEDCRRRHHRSCCSIRDLYNSELSKMVQHAKRARWRPPGYDERQREEAIQRQLEVFGQRLAADVREDRPRVEEHLNDSRYDHENNGQVRRRGTGMEWF